MQDPKTPDPGGQVEGPPTQTATEGASQPAPASPAIVVPEAPSAIGDAVAVTVEAPQDKEQAAETASTGESANGEVPPGLPPADAVVVPSDVRGATGEPEAQDVPAVTEVDEAVGTAEGPAATTVAKNAEAAATVDQPAATAAGEPAGDATDEPAETIGMPAGDVTDGIGDAAEDGTGEAAAEGDRAASEPIQVETTRTPSEEAEGIREALVAEALTSEPTVTEGSAVENPAAVETPAAAETVVEVTDGPAAHTAPEGSAPVGSTMATAPPAATDVPPTHGVWTPEQVEAFRARLSEATAKVVDKAAGAVIETVNTVAAAIRSRTSSQRRGDDHTG